MNQQNTQKEITFIAALIFIAGWVAKMPQLLHIQEDLFYQRNFSLIIFPFLIAYYVWKQAQTLKQVIFPAIVIIAAAVYINYWPIDTKSDSYLQSCIHLAVMLWTVFAYTYLGANFQKENKAVAFLRYNGDMVVMGAIIMLAGIVFIAISVGLFKLIGVSLESLLTNYILIWGLPAVPLIANYLVHNNPHFVNKISPVIAKIFTPFVLIMLSLFLVTIIYTGKYPYNDRDFLMVLNALLVGVMALILFSLAEASNQTKNRIQIFMLLGLSIVTILINGIALSAIVYRINEYGFTPNRVTVLGGDILILSNLIWVAFNLLQFTKQKSSMESVENSIAQFLPIYFGWAAFVSFILPILFQYK